MKKRANACAPPTLCVVAIAGMTGGFSPGLVFLPVSGTSAGTAGEDGSADDGAGVVVTEADDDDDVDVPLAGDEAGGVEGGDFLDDVHAVSNASDKIKAIGVVAGSVRRDHIGTFWQKQDAIGADERLTVDDVWRPGTTSDARRSTRAERAKSRAPRW